MQAGWRLRLLSHSHLPCRYTLLFRLGLEAARTFASPLGALKNTQSVG